MRIKDLSVRKIWLDLLLFECVGCVLGMLNGIIISGQSQLINDLVDPTPYHNLALVIGAISGFGIVFLGLIIYYILSRLILSRHAFNFRLLLIISGIVGATIDLIIYLILNRFAEPYGLAQRTGASVLFDIIITIILGGGFGLFASTVIGKVRGYGE